MNMRDRHLQLSPFQTLPSTTDDILLDHQTTAEIIRFGKTCSNANNAVQSYIKRKYKLSDLLLRFFKDEAEIEDLRTLMSRTGMVISGSMAFQFFDRTIYPESDLDLYAPLHYAQDIAAWMMSVGYHFVPRVPSLPNVDASILEAMTREGTPPAVAVTPSHRRGYLRAACILDFTASNPSRHIQVICSTRSVVELILGFHSTCVMNLITHEKAYCLFPRATLLERRALTYLYGMAGHESNRQAFLKWTSRGFFLGQSITHGEYIDPTSAFAPGKRYVGDSKCLVMPIYPLREDLAGRGQGSTVEINSFSFNFNNDYRPVFDALHVNLTGLKLPYVLTEEDADFIMQHVAAYGIVSLSPPSRTADSEDNITFDPELQHLFVVIRQAGADVGEIESSSQIEFHPNYSADETDSGSYPNNAQEELGTEVDAIVQLTSNINININVSL